MGLGWLSAALQQQLDGWECGTPCSFDPTSMPLAGAGAAAATAAGRVGLPVPLTQPVCPLQVQGQQQQQLDGWDSLFLDYQVDWPMGLMLTPPIMAR